MMRIEINKRYILLNLSVAFLMIGSILSYYGGDWYFQSGYLMTSPYSTQANMSYWVGSVLLLICALQRISYINYFSRGIQLLLVLMVVPSVAWCIMSIAANETVFTVIMRQYAPFMLVFASFFILGCDDEFYQHIVKVSRIIMPVALVVTLVIEMNFLLKFGFDARSKASALHVFYWETFLAWAFYMFNDTYSYKKLLTKLCTIGLLSAACLTLSRSNILVAVLCFFLYFRYADKEKHYKWDSYLKILIVVLLGIFAFSRFAPDAFQSLMDRLGNDTRTGQYITFFSQVSFKDLLIGGGTSATYSFSRFENYAYFDNANIVMAFRYGLVPVISMLLLLFSAVVKAWKHKLAYAWQIVFLWILVTNGLSVYLNYRITFGYFLVWLSVGKILSMKQVTSNLTL